MFSYVKDEGTNLGAMTLTLKVVVNCESLGLEDLSKAHVLGMPRWRCVNMAQLAKMFLWAHMTYLSNLLKQTFINVWHGFKTKERMLKVDKGIYQCGYVTMKTKDPYENVMRFYQVGIEFCFHD